MHVDVHVDVPAARPCRAAHGTGSPSGLTSVSARANQEGSGGRGGSRDSLPQSVSRKGLPLSHPATSLAWQSPVLGRDIDSCPGHTNFFLLYRFLILLERLLASFISTSRGSDIWSLDSAYPDGRPPAAPFPHPGHSLLEVPMMSLQCPLLLAQTTAS